MKHEPWGEAPLSTAVPLYAEVPESAGATKVYVRYKPIGGDWKTAQFKKLGDGWGGEIPCADVGDSTGEIKYFIQAANGEGDVVASYGRMSAPGSVKLVAQLEGEAPHLPDQDPPTKCAATSSDCPPNFPGCHGKEEKTSCSSNDDCEGGQTCSDGFCSSPDSGEEVPAKQNWVSINVQQDFLLLPSQNDVCLGGTGYTCFDTSGGYFKDAPQTGQGDDNVTGGIGLATTRILIGYDRLLGDNFMLGVRAGYVIGGGPQRDGGAAFLPVHAEARFAYWIGHKPFARKGFRFFAVAAAGFAEVDASLPTWAFPPGANQTEQQYNAWTKTGTGFAALGLGGMYAFTPGMGVTLEVRAQELFPTMGTAPAAQVGYAIGF
jgi:hypothetical protein